MGNRPPAGQPPAGIGKKRHRRRRRTSAITLAAAIIAGALVLAPPVLNTRAATSDNWSAWSMQTASSDCGAQGAGCPGPMNVPRQSFTATVLSGPACQTASAPSYCGKVVVAGGDTGNGGTSAELHDPSSGAWSLTGSLAVSRIGHTATALLGPECQGATPPAYCGKVLVAGGTSAASLPSAELYDPATGQWSLTGSLNNPRSMHTATLLIGAACHGATVPTWCGKVLITGGQPTPSSTSAPQFAELYDPAAGTWTQSGAMASLRFDDTATQLDGPQCSGVSPPVWCGRVLIAGGRTSVSGGWISSSEVYNPTTGTWSATGSLSTARFQHTASLLVGPPCTAASPPAYCGKVIVTGGAGASFNDLPQSELYDPSSGTWSTGGSLNKTRRQHTATTLPNGEVLVAGGEDPGSPTSGPRTISSAELYNPAIDAWSFTGSMVTARYLHAAVQLNNSAVLSVGGCCDFSLTNATLASTELYTPTDPAVYMSPGSLAFGRAEVGFATASQSVALLNGGTQPLSVSGATVVGANPADFAVASDTCSGAPVAPNSSCTISARFNPTAPGARSASLSIADNVPGSPQTVGLSGTGESALLAVTGTDGQLWTRQDAGPYTPLGGQLIGAPTVVAVPGASGTLPTPLYLGIGTDHNVYVRTLSQPWQALSATPAYCLDAVGATVAGTSGNLTLTVGCEGSDTALYYAQAPLTATGLPQVHGWNSLGGSLAGGPVVVSIGGRITFFVTGSNGTVWVRDTSSTGYVAMQYACNSRPAVAAAGATLYFACQGGDGALWYAVNTGVGWPAATSAGGRIVGGAGIAATSTRALIYVEGTDAGIYQIAVTPAGTATPFVRDGGAVQGGAAAAGMAP